MTKRLFRTGKFLITWVSWDLWKLYIEKGIEPGWRLCLGRLRIDYYARGF